MDNNKQHIISDELSDKKFQVPQQVSGQSQILDNSRYSGNIEMNKIFDLIEVLKKQNEDLKERVNKLEAETNKDSMVFVHNNTAQKMDAAQIQEYFRKLGFKKDEKVAEKQGLAKNGNEFYKFMEDLAISYQVNINSREETFVFLDLSNVEKEQDRSDKLTYNNELFLKICKGSKPRFIILQNENGKLVLRCGKVMEYKNNGSQTKQDSKSKQIELNCKVLDYNLLDENGAPKSQEINELLSMGIGVFKKNLVENKEYFSVYPLAQYNALIKHISKQKKIEIDGLDIEVSECDNKKNRVDLILECKKNKEGKHNIDRIVFINGIVLSGNKLAGIDEDFSYKQAFEDKQLANGRVATIMLHAKNNRLVINCKVLNFNKKAQITVEDYPDILLEIIKASTQKESGSLAAKEVKETFFVERVKNQQQDNPQQSNSQQNKKQGRCCGM